MLPDQQLVMNALVTQESNGNSMALSNKGAAGKYQIMPETARDPGYGVRPLQGWDGKDPRTAPPEEQERFANDYLAAMAKKNGGDRTLALAAYNAGPGAVEAYGGVPPYRETQNYVKSINSMVDNRGTQMASNDWRVPAPQAPQQPAQATQPTSGGSWRVAAPAGSSWRAEVPKVEAPKGQDMGAGTARVQGFNSAVPFGERIAAGLGAVGAKAYDATLGSGATEGQSIGELYREARDNQEVTAENNSGAYTTGAVAGIAAQLPLLSTKLLTGTRATSGARGAVNAVPEMLSSVGNWARGSKVAADAGRGAKVANLADKAVRGAVVAAPSAGVYGYGASRNDLDSEAAAKDAAVSFGLGAGVGAALPVAGAAIGGAVLPKVSEGAKSLARRAKEFGIDLSLDQLGQSRMRDTVQKISQSLPASGVGSFHEKQSSQWMKAVAKTIGEDADNLAPDVINNYLTRASNDFNTTLSGKKITFSQQDINSLADVTAQASRKVSADLAKVVKNNVDDVIKNLSEFKVGKSRTVAGEKLASLRSQLVKDLPTIQGGAREQVANIIDKIDDVVNRHLSPEEVKQLATARNQWRNYRTIEPLLEKATDGTINPTQLLQRVASSKFIKASRNSVGEDDLVDLARIGKRFLVKKGGSDTVPNALLGGGALGNAALIAGAPAAAVPALLGQGALIGVNRGYQSLVNQSPALARMAVGKSDDVVGKMLAAPSLTKEITRDTTGSVPRVPNQSKYDRTLDDVADGAANSSNYDRLYDDATDLILDTKGTRGWNTLVDFADKDGVVSREKIQEFFEIDDDELADVIQTELSDYIKDWRAE